MNRRGFLSIASLAGLEAANPAWLKQPNSALQVNATTTVFFSHPAGERNLVRFEVTGIEAQAGRLRVFDRSRRLVGTAGVLRSGEGLYGELWLQLDGAATVVSELEAPGIRGPFRTTHRITPARRWTIHLLTIADPVVVRDTLDSLRPIHRAVQAEVIRKSAVTVNPISYSGDISALEHVPFLRLAERATVTEQEFAIPMGNAAYLPPGVHLPKTAAIALAELGVRVMIREQADSVPYEWWDAPGGGRLLVVSVPDGSTPSALGFDSTQNEMVARVENWLSSTALRFEPAEDSGTAVVLNSDLNDSLPNVLSTVEAWNSRFAYPRMVVRTEGTLFDDLQSTADQNAVGLPVSIGVPRPPAQRDLGALADLRESQSRERNEALAAVLSAVVAPGSTNIADVAACVDTAVAGTVVFNSSPFPRSELVRMSDGTDRLATNLPGLGYAFFPDRDVAGAPAGWAEAPTRLSAQGQAFRVTIDGDSGAIGSLTQIANGKAWTRPNSIGLNVLPDARLESVAVSRMDGIATRLTVSRFSPTLDSVISKITLYDDEPWLDISNEIPNAPGDDVEYRFGFQLSEPKVEWEIPAGSESAVAPVSPIEHLRWIRLLDGGESILIRGYQTPLASVDETGALTSFSPAGASRYRLAPMDRYSGQDAAWVFGWNSEPLLVARVEPNGTGLLPRYGPILAFEQAGICVVGLRPAADGFGVIAYLQETLGVSRDVAIRPGVLRFRYAEAVDYLERRREDINIRTDGTAHATVPAHGVVAVRLSGLELS